MRTLMIVLSMIFLNSCKAPSIKPRPLCDVSIIFDRCRCRCYDLMQIKEVDDALCGEDFVSGNGPAHECEGLGGFDLDDIAENINPWAKETKEYYEDTCSGALKERNNQ